MKIINTQDVIFTNSLSATNLTVNILSAVNFTVNNVSITTTVSSNVKAFGAKGDGVTDDWLSLQTAISALSGISKVYIPKGTYIISRELRIPSNSYVYGDGVGVTIIKLANSATVTQNVLTNSENTRSYLTNRGNQNIVIRDLEVDGNVSRFVSYSAPGDTSGCGIGLAAVSGAFIENVYSHDCCNHCFDVAAAEYGIGDFLTTPMPSTNIHLKDIQAKGAGDDNITTHYSHNIIIENAYVTNKGGTLVPTNSNGIEVDDGSYDVTIIGGYIKNCMRGVEIKGHDTTLAARKVRVIGTIAENNVRNFELRHLGFDDGSSGSAQSVQLYGCTSLTPLSSINDPTLDPRALKISNYNGVYVRDFTCMGTIDAPNLVTVQEGAQNVVIDGLMCIGISGSNTGITDSLVKIQSNVLKNVTLKNLNFFNCVGLPIYVTGVKPGINIDGVNATTTVNPSSMFVINFSYTPQQMPYTIKNVTFSGYASAYTLGASNHNYLVPRDIYLPENIVPANASNPEPAARFGWVEGESQGLNAGCGTRIDFTGNIYSGVSALNDITIAYIGTAKQNGDDSDLTSSIVFASISANNSTLSNKMILSSNGDTELPIVGSGIIMKSPDGTRYRLTIANGGTVSVAAA